MDGEIIIIDEKKHNGFLKRLNTEPDLLRRFLDNPIKVLDNEGGTKFKSAKDAKNFKKAVNYLKLDVFHIFEIPQGSSMFLEKMRWGLDMRDGKPRITLDVRGI